MSGLEQRTVLSSEVLFSNLGDEPASVWHVLKAVTVFIQLAQFRSPDYTPASPVTKLRNLCYLRMASDVIARAADTIPYWPMIIGALLSSHDTADPDPKPVDAKQTQIEPETPASDDSILGQLQKISQDRAARSVDSPLGLPSTRQKLVPRNPKPKPAPQLATEVTNVLAHCLVDGHADGAAAAVAQTRKALVLAGMLQKHVGRSLVGTTTMNTGMAPSAADLKLYGKFQAGRHLWDVLAMAALDAQAAMELDHVTRSLHRTLIRHLRSGGAAVSPQRLQESITVLGLLAKSLNLPSPQSRQLGILLPALSRDELVGLLELFWALSVETREPAPTGAPQSPGRSSGTARAAVVARMRALAKRRVPGGPGLVLLLRSLA
ncbi:hypothetical protein HK405_008490, partial [Cladochytrium tenue]